MGTMQHAEKYIPKLVSLISQGTNVKVHADKDGRVGSRMYVYTGDIAKAIVTLLLDGETGEKYNILA
jgi:dTDP-D-glucose 4,6-dehydratase